MNSREYWRKRETEQMRHYVSEESVYQEKLREIYAYMMDQIQKEIQGFYARYAKKEGITLSEARKRVFRLDIEEYGRKAAKYVREKDFSKEANEEMRLYNATMKINRLEMLKANIGLEMVDGFNDLQKHFDQILNKRALDEFTRQAGILGDTILDNGKAAEVIVNASFHNAKFSNRIWMYQGMLKAELDKLLRQGLIQGKHPTELSRHLVKLFGVSAYNAERLMRTELARVQTEAQKQSFKANGYKKYTFIALGSACGICLAIDGKHFDVDKMTPGVNAPPMHPNCRCSTAGWMDEDDFNKWTDKQETIEKKTNSGIIKEKGNILEMYLQFFAEKDIKNQESASLKRAIGKYQARIEEHQAKISNPGEIYPEWATYDVRYQEGLKRHWNKEIRNFKQSIQDRIDELKERGDYDE